MASHVFIRRLIPRDLDQLHGAEHRNPNELQGNPDVKDDGESVSKDETAKYVIENIAFRLRRLR